MPKLALPKFKDELVIDIETYDPDLLNTGPGVYLRKDAYVLGCGVYDATTGESTYYPIHAKDLSEEYLQRSIGALKELLASDRDKVLANGAYDIDWLENGEGIKVNGFIHDVQLAEPLLDSYRLSYSLDALAHYYGVEGKKMADIEAYAERLDPAHKYKDARQLLWLMPTEVVGDYCCGDLAATYKVYKKQIPLLEQQELLDLYKVECNLIRIRLMMRKNGIRIDRAAQEHAISKALMLEDECRRRMYDTVGTFNINSSQQIAPILTKLGVDLPRTRKGALSVTKDTLAKLAPELPFCADLLRCRQLNKLRTTFLEKSISEHLCPDGRIHGQFHQLKKDDAGTITGRWSSTDPNLQQIPRNDKELGALARGMFVPDEGCWYGHTDYSQVEYRVFSHYARGWKDGDELDVQAQAMRDLFNEKPHTDYHQFVIDTVKNLTGVTMERPTAKRVNFGVLYFMGAASLSRKFNIPFTEAKEVYDALFSALPFIDSTRTRVVNSAKVKGYVKTFCGRKQRVGEMHIAAGARVTFPDGRVVVGRQDEGDKYYPLFNYLIQGTAADIMKYSLLACYEAGVYDVLKLHLLVHDETGVSIPKTLEGMQAYEEQQRLLGNTVKLKVPILAEADFGDNWGEMIAEGDECFPKMRELLGV